MTPRSRRRPTRWRPSPFVTTLLVAAVAAGVWWSIDRWNDGRVTLVFDDRAASTGSLELTFYPDQFAFTAPSPPPAIGSLQLGGARSVTVGRELVPQRGVVRFRGGGIGAGVVHVRLGVDPPPIALQPPSQLHGRVGQPVCAWWMGWRPVAFRAVADAEVVLMGGGEHGIDLVATRTARDGHFTLDGFDGERSALGVRVRAEGFGIEHRHIEQLRGAQAGIVTVFETPPRRGRLRMGVDVDPTTIRVLVRNLPGIEAVPAADGSFTLDHVPADVEARVLLYGLPGTCSYPSVRTDRRRAVEIEVVPAAVVRGLVVDSRNGRPVAEALVWVDDGDAVRAGADGSFELRGVLPGLHRLTAQWRASGRKAKARLGRREVTVAAGCEYGDVEISID